MLFTNMIGAIEVYWIWFFLIVGVVVGFLVAVYFARFRFGREFLDAVFRGLSSLFRSPPKISRAFGAWRENRQRRRIESAVAAKEIKGLEVEIDDLKEQIRERRQKIREARWRVSKPQ